MKKVAILVMFMVLVICMSQFMAVAEDTYSYNTNIRTFINDKGCRGCHNDFIGSYAVIMAKTSNWNGTTVSLVSPAQPDSSLIIWMIEGIDINGLPMEDGRMPRGGDYYSEAEILIFRDWITQGALEDIPSSVDDTKSWIEIKSKFK
ncbi:hypothetical protein ACFL6K_06425 [Candidatus Latescibacterota bacterium]